MKKLTGFAVVNCEVGKKIAYTYTTLDDDGNTIASNTKESFAVVDEAILNAIQIIENNINTRITE
jgi:hypothetical protein